MKHKGIIPYLVGVLCTAVYISLIFNNNVWLDEAFSASIIRCGFREMISRTFADTLPPFYNISAWIFTHTAGFSTVKLKLFSVIPMALLMLISAYFIPKAATLRTSCLYMIFMTAMPHFLEHGVEIRMYSWAVLFSAATAVFALCRIKNLPHSEIWLVVSTVLGAYTHQYALIAEAFIWLMLLVYSIQHRELKRWSICAAVCVICYIPCAVLTVFQMRAATAYFSASPATLESMMSSARYPFVTNVTALSALLMTFMILIFVYAFTKKEYLSVYFISVYILVTLLSFWIMKVTDSTFFSSRYLLPALGIMWLGAAISLDRLLSENRYVCFVTVPLLTAVFIVIYTQQYRAEYTDMSKFEEFITSTGEGDGYVIFEDIPEIEICLGYYAPWLKVCSVDDIGSVKGKKYLFVNKDMHTDDIEKIKSRNFDLKYVENLSFDRYTFRAYELTGKDR